MKFRLILKIIFILPFYFSITNTFSQEKTILYFDSNWKETTKENHAYYRVLPLKEIGELVLIEDFYKNGNRQMQGYALKDQQDTSIGDIYWYDENGFDTNFAQYYNTSSVPELTYYYPDGKIWKKILYKNEVKHGTTTVYTKDGEVLMTGIYNNRKPISGDFVQIENADDYYGNSRLKEETEKLRTKAVIIDDYDAPKVKTTNPPISLRVKSYWHDGKHLAQVKEYSAKKYDPTDYELQSQKNYNSNNQLLQQIKGDNILYGYKIDNGIVYDYYTQNSFAMGIKSETPFVKNVIHGEVISYYSNGKIGRLANYKEGSLDGETIEFDKKGAVINKLIYKKGDPFEGAFKIDFNADISIYANYEAGIQVDEIVAKSKTGTIIAKGFYKGGKPFEGSFVIENEVDNQNEIIQVANFKRTGKQIVFYHDYQKPSETYTMQNGVKNGETIFYDDDQTIVSKINYKDGKPYDGVLTGDKEVLTYKNGMLSEQVIVNSYRTDDQKIIRQFENKVPTKVLYSNQFVITDHPQKEYSGTYKDGKPFDGYFREQESEFKAVDYYKNGVLVNQFSNDYLKNMDNYRFQTYDLKSTFKDGKVFDGMEYQKRDKEFISLKWQDGVLQAIDYDVFAMHYFNRIHCELLKDVIEITEHASKAKIIIEKKNSIINKSVVYNDKTLISTTLSRGYVNDPLPKNGNRNYYIEDNAIKVEDAVFGSNSNDDERNLNIIYSIFSNLDFDADTINEYFNAIANMILTKDGENSYSFLEYNNKSENNNIIAAVRTNENSQPIMGVQLLSGSNSSYDLQLFDDSKSVKTVKNVLLINIEKEISKLYKLLKTE
ncbi:toxin-antitoxin system YwqK family antitoxin [Flavobacterium algicola]|uniref:toxin-antitoxin system YwqK family antitoxin n=1 Tax=Flavobacterium algicola TaxID=556529 RepID=UPI001EFC7ADB|nr:hypothetical protein [Flavobacterium algicola]MCG9792443.1 hypothetical protein [Flavobacterium algicola]